MILQLGCDVCGKVGTAGEITTDYDDRDLCKDCALEIKLYNLKYEYAHKKEWLELTHLKDLRDLEKQIAGVEAELKSRKGHDVKDERKVE